jgi:hypothetical protein
MTTQAILAISAIVVIMVVGYLFKKNHPLKKIGLTIGFMGGILFGGYLFLAAYANAFNPTGSAYFVNDISEYVLLALAVILIFMPVIYFLYKPLVPNYIYRVIGFIVVLLGISLAYDIFVVTPRQNEFRQAKRTEYNQKVNSYSRDYTLGDNGGPFLSIDENELLYIDPNFATIRQTPIGIIQGETLKLNKSDGTGLEYFKNSEGNSIFDTFEYHWVDINKDDFDHDFGSYNYYYSY